MRGTRSLPSRCRRCRPCRRRGPPADGPREEGRRVADRAAHLEDASGPIDRASVARSVATAGPTIGIVRASRLRLHLGNHGIARREELPDVAIDLRVQRHHAPILFASYNRRVALQKRRRPSRSCSTSSRKRSSRAIVETRRDLHRHPELGFEEKRTAAIVADRLTRLRLSAAHRRREDGCDRDRGAGPEGTDPPARDMDGLPSSGRDRRAVRLDGPRARCTRAATTATWRSPSRWRRGSRERAPRPRVRYLFQPAEEAAGGRARLRGRRHPRRCRAAFGLHLWNQIPVGKIGVNRGALMAAVDEFSIDVEGPGGHGAAPHETYDAIVGAARIVEALQSIVSRGFLPIDPAVVTVGSIHGGSAFNIIPKSPCA